MKKSVAFTIALICACILTAGIASAGKHQQSVVPAKPVYSAGLSPQLAIPHPKTKATLNTDANRLIRWEGWLDVDAFSVSVLAQVQYQIGNGFELGTFTIDEESILEAVMKARMKNPTFVMNENLETGESFEKGSVKLYVWTYRHNYADKGLYQLYVSAKGKMLIGTQITEVQYPEQPGKLIPHKDIQSLGYEFGSDGATGGTPGGTVPREVDVYADVEAWRGVVVSVDAKGVLEYVGNEAGLKVDPQPAPQPFADMEIAPSLIGNPSYKPKDATGADYWNPLDHPFKINGNDDQLRPGDTRDRGLRVVPTTRFKLFR